MIQKNPCFRCGKQRIVSKTYTEIIDGSSLTYTDYVCPDPECQKLLNLQFAEEKIKREQFAMNKALATEARLKGVRNADKGSE